MLEKDNILQLVEEARKEGKTIGLVHGSWDLFHLGHLKYLLSSKSECDFLVVAMDSDEKIRARKGPSRPVIPEEERFEFLQKLGFIDAVTIRHLNAPKQSLIKDIHPDVLIVIEENYTPEGLEKLKNICGRVAIKPRQAETSTSAKIRQIILQEQAHVRKLIDNNISKSIDSFKDRINYSEETPEAVQLLVQHMKEATDWVCPIAASCYVDDKWYFGSNQIDMSLSILEIESRSELFYDSIEHAEVNLLKKLSNKNLSGVPIWTTRLPGYNTMKVLLDKGITEIIYLEDRHNKERNKRSHEFAKKHGIKLTKVIENPNHILEDEIDATLLKSINGIKERTGFNDTELTEPWNYLFEEIKQSTDYKVPVAAGCCIDGIWHFGSNKIDETIPKEDIEKRTELFYSTVEHAEINLLKNLGYVESIDSIFVTLFPCDICMKVLIDKGVKEIYYLEDHPEKGWSKRAHERADAKGVKTIQIVKTPEVVTNPDEIELPEENVQEVLERLSEYVSLLNARDQRQLDIMVDQATNGIDPLDPQHLVNKQLFTTPYWYVTLNEFPIVNAEYQILISSLTPIYKLEDMPEEMWIDLMRVWFKLINELNIPGGALAFRFGDAVYSGSTLKRIHAHVVQPIHGQKAKFAIGGNPELKEGLKLNMPSK